MDTKRLLVGMVVCSILIGGWFITLHLIDRAHPEYAQQQKALEEQQAKERAGETEPTPPASKPATTEPTTSPTTQFLSAGLHMVEAPAQPAVAVLGSDREKDADYPMQVVLNSRTASISKVTLNQFRQKVKEPDLYAFQEPYQDHPETSPLALRVLSVDDNKLDTEGAWVLEKSDHSNAVFTALVTRGDKPVARLTRTYHLDDVKAGANAGKGYELKVDTTIQNLTDKQITVQITTNGPTVPPKEVERGTDQQILIGNQNGSAIKVTQKAIEEFHGDKAEEDLTGSTESPVIWAGTGSVYFSALYLPDTTSSTATKTDYTIKAENLETKDATPSRVAMTFQTAQVKIAPDGKASLPLNVFLGPKERALLETPYYASFPRSYNETLVIASGICGYCTFAPLINALVAMLRAFHFVFRDWGIAIICLVIIVRILLHPITKKSQVHMVKMGKMGPEMERLKQKYADDKDALNKAMVQFYKEQGMAPVLGCLPMFLQMPIWIALWSALQSTFELRHSPFLFFGPAHLTWIHDLANPDALISFSPISIFGWTSISSFNILPLLLAVVFFFQQKFTPRPITTTPEQAQQQKMMMWMSTLMFPIFLYKGPAGLNLYILTSTTIGIIESKIIRDHIKQRDEAEKAGRVIVETRATRGARRRDEKKEAPPKKKGVMGWLSDLQQRAEDLRREMDKGK